MYPLNVSNAAIGGYAVASNAEEHAALTALGYVPALESELVADVDELETLREQVAAKGIKVDKRWKEDRLREELAKG